MKLFKILTCIMLFIFPIWTFGQTKILVIDSSKIEKKITNQQGKSYEKIEIEDALYTNEVGMPDLPVFYFKFYVPKGKKVCDVVFSGKEKTELNLQNDIVPAQHQVKISSVESDSLFDAPDPDVYGEDTFYPEKQAIIFRSDFVDGDLEVITIAAYPIQYNPIQKKVVMTLRGEISLSIASKNTNNTNKFEGHSNENETVRLVKTIVENPEDVASDGRILFGKVNEPNLKSVQTTWSVPFYEYVVITSRALKPAFNQFVNWKKRKGFNAGIVCIEDILADQAATGDNLSSPALVDSAGKLRQYLYAGYSNTSPKTKYALLGGDYTVVPIRYGKGGSDEEWDNGIYKVPADLYFYDFNSNWSAGGTTKTGTYYSGFDHGPEIFVGRLLCNSSEDIKRWTTKVLCYEQNPGNTNYSYLSKALLTEADGIGNINASDLPSFFTTVTSWTELPSDGSLQPYFPKGADVISELNYNYGLYCISNHGNPNSFATATADINQGYTPLWRYQVTSSDAYTSANITSETGNGLDNLTNYNYPTIVYSVSCNTMPFDDYDENRANHKIPTGSRTIGTSYTVAYNGGGPAYIGYTRDASRVPARCVEDCFFDSISSFPQIGIAVAKSKLGYNDHCTCLGNNLLGCPETELWTATPTTYTPTINSNGSSVSVNAGVSGSKICVMSALDNGSSYFDVEPNATSHTFSNLPKYYYVTITKHNKIPYQQNPTNVLIENKTFSSYTYLNCQTVSAGYSVDPNNSPDGNVVIANGASVTFDATGDILLSNGFEVQLGATFEAK